MSIVSTKISLQTPKTQLEFICEGWGLVQNENLQHRSLVTEKDWNAWKNYEASVNEKLNSVINGFDGKTLSKESREYIRELAGSINQAKRMNSTELQNRLDEINNQEIRKSADAETKRQLDFANRLAEENKAAEKAELVSFKDRMLSLFKRN